MHKEDIIKLAGDFIKTDPGNRISRRFALEDSLIGVQMYDDPLVGFGSAQDFYFERFKEPGVIGPHFKKPEEWLENARTVISIFLPASQRVRNDNKTDMKWPSPAWLYTRIEGQAMIGHLIRLLQQSIQAAGYEAVVPVSDWRFKAWEAPGGSDDGPLYNSNWSERHAAFVCGLGTFGLSKGLISSKGVAGRYTSLVTSLHLPPSTREYDGIYDNCSRCGACAKNCPVQAISLETGKDHTKCAAFIRLTKEKYSPRYGCGKCQVKVPCESRACRKAAISKPDGSPGIPIF